MYVIKSFSIFIFNPSFGCFSHPTRQDNKSIEIIKKQPPHDDCPLFEWLLGLDKRQKEEGDLFLPYKLKHSQIPMFFFIIIFVSNT